MKLDASQRLTRFHGLNNVADPMRGTDPGTKTALTWEWLQEADNVDVTDSNGLARREGYSAFLAATSITGSYSTFDFTRLYLVDNGALKRVYPDGGVATLRTGLSGTPYWGEINDTVYLSCGSDKLQIERDNSVIGWGVPNPVQPALNAVSGSLPAGLYQAVLTYTDSSGREGGACAAVELSCAGGAGIEVSNVPQLEGYTPQLYMTEGDGTVFYHVVALPGVTSYTVTTPPQGRELTTQFMDAPPPASERTVFFKGRAYLAEYIPAADQTVLWASQPLGFHLFNLNEDYLIVPGEVTQLCANLDTLVIATNYRIFLYDSEQLQQVAEYGAVAGQHADLGSDGKVYLWTNRGLCRAAPFENMIEDHVSVAPGLLAGGGIVERGGFRKYLAVINRGGSAHNARS